jgi:hypothetical protein
MPIFRRKDCIHTASGIFALCKRLHRTQVESGLQSALNQCSVHCIVYYCVFGIKVFNEIILREQIFVWSLSEELTYILYYYYYYYYS